MARLGIGTFDAIRVAARIPAIVADVTEVLAPKLADGKLTPDEVEAAVGELLEDHPDLIRIKVNGVDVVDEEAERHLVAFVARVVATAINARNQ